MDGVVDSLPQSLDEDTRARCIHLDMTLPSLRLSLTASLTALCLLLGASAGRADPIRIVGAGILVAPVKEAIAASGLPASTFAAPAFGPAGVMRERIEKGDPADLFLSADLAQPKRLEATGRMVVPFARNRLCIIAKASLHLTPETLLDRLSMPDVRLATSTPVLDAAGDFSEALYAKANAVKAGAGDLLRQKALKLIGTPGAMTPVEGRTVSESIFLSNKADALLYYCSGQSATLRNVPGLSLTELPPNLSVPVVLGMAVRPDNPEALRFALFLLSERGQAILAQHEFAPLVAE